MNARRQSRNAPEQHAQPQRAKQAEDAHFRSLRPRPHESKAVERHTAGIEIQHLRQQAPKSPDVPQEANEAEDWYFRRSSEARTFTYEGFGATTMRLATWPESTINFRYVELCNLKTRPKGAARRQFGRRPVQSKAGCKMNSCHTRRRHSEREGQMSQLKCFKILQLLNWGGKLLMGIVPGLISPWESEILK
ncbi:hypothetical protein SLS64_008381 [Diaporthe eres]|uniref:Uncharacterized protein n=1 Tax=Diaporthe eres TaxID=83184 RepID=A0ABR1PH09_DIAER